MARIASALGLNRTYCYALLKPSEPSAGPDPDADLKDRIRALCGRFPTYGYRRITALLRRPSKGLVVNRKKVARLMSEMGLSVTIPEKRAKRKKYRPKTLLYPAAPPAG